MRNYVTVVSGMPRSGTSMMMRMLEAGGIAALTDGRRGPDEQNPHGYFEYEPTKRLAEDSSWMEEAAGKAVKVIYHLLPNLPPRLEYRVIFMERRMEEIFESQRVMLRARGDAAAEQFGERLIAALNVELRRARQWLERQPRIRVLAAPYAEVVREAVRWSNEVAQFLGGGLDAAAMAGIVDEALYRERRSSCTTL